MGVVQVTLLLDEPGITVTRDPDPTGGLVKLAKGQGLSGPELDPLSEERLSGSLRITLTQERADQLVSELSRPDEG